MLVTGMGSAGRGGGGPERTPGIAGRGPEVGGGGEEAGTEAGQLLGVEEAEVVLLGVEVGGRFGCRSRERGAPRGARGGRGMRPADP